MEAYINTTLELLMQLKAFGETLAAQGSPQGPNPGLAWNKTLMTKATELSNLLNETKKLKTAYEEKEPALKDQIKEGERTIAGLKTQVYDQQVLVKHVKETSGALSQNAILLNINAMKKREYDELKKDLDDANAEIVRLQANLAAASVSQAVNTDKDATIQTLSSQNRHLAQENSKLKVAAGKTGTLADLEKRLNLDRLGETLTSQHEDLKTAMMRHISRDLREELKALYLNDTDDFFFRLERYMSSQLVSDDNKPLAETISDIVAQQSDGSDPSSLVCTVVRAIQNLDLSGTKAAAKRKVSEIAGGPSDQRAPVLSNMRRTRTPQAEAQEQHYDDSQMSLGRGDDHGEPSRVDIMVGLPGDDDTLAAAGLSEGIRTTIRLHGTAKNRDSSVRQNAGHATKCFAMQTIDRKKPEEWVDQNQRCVECRRRNRACFFFLSEDTIRIHA